MSRFTAPLVVTPTADYRAWRVIRSSSNDPEQAYGWDALRFGYDIGEEGSGLSIEIPHLFETDFASIPWFARWLIKTWGRHTNAAIIHDYLYRGGQISEISENAPGGFIKNQSKHRLYSPMTRKQADRIMLEAMEVMNVRKWTQLAIYCGLRLGGWWAWRKFRR